MCQYEFMSLYSINWIWWKNDIFNMTGNYGLSLAHGFTQRFSVALVMVLLCIRIVTVSLLEPLKSAFIVQSFVPLNSAFILQCFRTSELWSLWISVLCVIINLVSHWDQYFLWMFWLTDITYMYLKYKN